LAERQNMLKALSDALPQSPEMVAEHIRWALSASEPIPT
jgi:hypothetical protein